MTTLPWDYSLPKLDGTDLLNVPSAEGAELGEQLARFADMEEPRVLAQFPGIKPRCNDCAFRRGTLPNQCLPTVMDALKCVVESSPFYCHKGIQEGDEPKRLCGGFQLLFGVGSELALKMQAQANASRRARNKRKADRRARRSA